MNDLRGKTFVVTGANAGIGRATAEALAARGGRLVLCGRSAERTEPVLAGIRERDPAAEVSFIRLDLASLASVAEAAQALLQANPRIDVLIDNAGLAGHRGQTEDGFEIQFGVNHLGHFLFTALLLPRLLESAPARVVVVSSGNHRQAKSGIDFEAVQRTTATAIGLREYNVSKLANVLFAKELARRHGDRGLTAVALNPGQVASQVWRRIPWPFRQLFIKLARMRSNEEGAQTSIHCATAPREQLENGGYYEDSARAQELPLACDRELAEELWRRSEDWVQSWMPNAPA